MAAEEICNEIKAKMETATNLRWIDPHLLAEAGEDFLIYSPLTSNYLFMSKDPALSHKFHTKLEAHASRDFERNTFRLKKTENGLFHLQNVETEKYVYVSGDDVLGVDGNPSESKAHFEFKKFGDSGCYMIENDKKCIYVSKNKAGIPPCPVVHAAESVDDNTHVFQFVLLKDVKDATISFDISKLEHVTVEKESLVYTFENPSDEDKKEEVTVKQPDASKDEFKFESGFEFFGNYIGGVPVWCKVGDRYEAQTTERNMPRSIDSDRSVTVKNASTTTTITISPGRKTTMKVYMKEAKMSSPFFIEVTTANKKVLKGAGMWYGGAAIDSGTTIDTESLDGSKE